MSKKFFFLIGVFVFWAACVSLPLRAQYKTENITVPPGYEITKIAESNRALDAYRLTFDSRGYLIAGSYNYMIFAIDPSGGVEVIGKTRKYNINPLEVEPVPNSSSYVIRAQIVDGAGNPGVYKFTPPDNYEKLFESPSINAIGYDKQGNFYAVVRGDPVQDSDPVRYHSLVNRYDNNFQLVETAFSFEWGIRDFCFDSQNNMYMLVPGARGSLTGGTIIKLFAGPDGIPGKGDFVNFIASYSLTAARDMTIDSSGNLYIDEYLHTNTDGYSSYDIFMLTKISAEGKITRDIGPDFQNPNGLVCKDNSLYVSEMDRGVVAKVDLETFQKTDFTKDTGITSAGSIAFDAADRLYTQSFRQLKLFRLNPSGQFDQVGAGTGSSQQIASDGTYLYVGSLPTIPNVERQILRIDPVSGTTEVVAYGNQNVKGWRSLAFDSFWRLILNTEIDINQNIYGADIIDLATGMSTPYVRGLHNKGRDIQFDVNQNFYFVEGIGEGIKKVHLDLQYPSPRDLSSEPLFYNLNPGGDPYPPTVYFFCVNPLLQEAFIPLMDVGTILYGDAGGNVELFAQGFLFPSQVTFDRYGALYVSDAGNGIFKIVHKGWTIPAIIKLKEKLLDEVRQSHIEIGIQNSLVKKLVNIDKDLEKGNITPAINLLSAFKHEVVAQRGNKIPADLADNWTKKVDDIIKALEEVK